MQYFTSPVNTHTPVHTQHITRVKRCVDHTHMPHPNANRGATMYAIRFPLEHRSARPSLAPFPVGSPLCTPKGCQAQHPRAKVLRGNKPRETHPR